MIMISIPGVPKPAGSKTAMPLKNKYTGEWVTAANGRPVVNVVDDNPNSREWKSHVKSCAREQYDGQPIIGAVRVTFSFAFPRPKGHYGTGRNAGIVKPGAPVYHLQKPDVLKLARAAEDALTGVVWRDDCQIVSEHMEKSWTEQADGSLLIAVEPLE